MTMKAIFRKFKKEGDVIALFHCISASNGMVMSYQHIGQHSEADYKGLLKITVLANPVEYGPLLKELESIYGCTIQVIKVMK